jgi:hypothetical protein
VGPHNYVKAVVRCRDHRSSSATICLRVEREVPEPLRCSPGGGGGGTTLGGFGPCPCTQSLTITELMRLVNEAMRRGLGQWIKLGAVVIEV